MNSEQILNIPISVNVLTTDKAYSNIISVQTETLTCESIKIASISVEQNVYELSSPNPDLNIYTKKSELSDYFRVVPHEPDPEIQATHPNVMWLISCEN